MFEMAVHYSVREVREEEQKKWLSEKESLLNEKENLQRSWLTEKEEKEKYLEDKMQLVKLVRTLLELTDIETVSKKTGLSVEEINELTGSK